MGEEASARGQSAAREVSERVAARTSVVRCCGPVGTECVDGGVVSSKKTMKYSRASRRVVEAISARTATWVASHRTMASLSVALGVAAAASALPSPDVRLDAASHRADGPRRALMPFAHGCKVVVGSLALTWEGGGLLDRRQPREVCANAGSSQEYESVQRRYDLEVPIGQGGFGVVHAARSRETGDLVAVKMMERQATSRDKYLQEVAILADVGGKCNIVDLCDAFETKESFVMVMEYVDGGELFEHLLESGVFEEDRAQKLVVELCHALSYLHANDVVHADIKPENILVGERENGEMLVRLIDFGLAYRQHDESERQLSTTGSIGTLAYAAPEYLSRQESDSSVDIWALGVVLYIILCGYHPFDAENDASDEELRRRIVKGEFDRSSDAWMSMSSGARCLIAQMLSVDPTQRPTAVEVLDHAWLSATA